MNYSDLENKNTSELREILANLRREMFNFRLQAAAVSAPVSNPSRYRQCRRDVARIKTKLTQLIKNK